ncbi:enoyl-CoA hydratase-related protein, partial [Thermodesulfobacteriota bacterium]
MSDLVTISIENHVAYVKLNRAEKYNARNAEMFVEIVDAGRSVSADPSIRAVVLSGEGKGFCAGLGLVTRICENPFEAAGDMAQEIADKSPDAIAAGKQLLEEAWHGSSVDGLDLEARLQKKI